MPGGLSDRGGVARLGDDSQVARRSGRGRPDAQVPGLPGPRPPPGTARTGHRRTGHRAAADHPGEAGVRDSTLRSFPLATLLYCTHPGGKCPIAARAQQYASRHAARQLLPRNLPSHWPRTSAATRQARSGPRTCRAGSPPWARRSSPYSRSSRLSTRSAPSASSRRRSATRPRCSRSSPCSSLSSGRSTPSR